MTNQWFWSNYLEFNSGSIGWDNILNQSKENSFAFYEYQFLNYSELVQDAEVLVFFKFKLTYIFFFK